MHTDKLIPTSMAAAVALGLGLGAGVGSGCHADVPDASITDPDKYQIVLDNEHVRVLRYRDQPGTRTHQHHHPAFVLYALAPFERRLTFPDGSTRERRFAAGDAAWMPA